MPTITPLPTPPSRSDPANFSARADAFLAAMVLFQQELNALLPSGSAGALSVALANGEVGSGADLVGYRSSLTAAVSRTVRHKLQTFIDVKDFGAVGDGVTDDTTAIQAAIDAAYSLTQGTLTVPYATIRRGGAVVSIPYGAYKTTATLEIKEGVSLAGAGRWATCIASSVNGPVIRNATPVAYDAHGMGLRDLSIIGDRTKASQDGVALLRDWLGEYANVSVVNCGRYAWRLYQCVQTRLLNCEGLVSVGRGLYATDGITSWTDTTPTNLPTNNIRVEDCHFYGNDGTGIRLGRIGSGIGVMGAQFVGGSSEYNYASSSPGVGYNIECIDTASAVPNTFTTMWCEDTRCLSHLYFDLADAQEAVVFNNFRHFANGSASWPQKAGIVAKGRLIIQGAVGSGSMYRTYLGSNAPWQLTKATGSIHARDLTGSGLSSTTPQIVDETGASTGLEANVRVDNYGQYWGPIAYHTDNGQAGPSFYQTGQAYPYADFSTFYKGLMFGSGSAAPDAGLTRLGADELGVMAGDLFNTGSTWNGSHLKMGGYHLWIDGTGHLRIKASAPSSDTDGTLVGA